MRVVWRWGEGEEGDEGGEESRKGGKRSKEGNWEQSGKITS